MFNTVEKSALLPAEVAFSTTDTQLPPRLLGHLTFYWVNVTSFLGDDIVAPTSGRYHVYFRATEFSGWEEADISLDARTTGATLIPDGFERAAYFSGVISELKVVPVDVVGADSFTVFVAQSDRGSNQPNTRMDVYGVKRAQVVNTTQAQFQMLNGAYFVGTTTAPARAIPSVVYSILRSGDKHLAIVGIEATTNVANTGEGDVTEQLRAYVETSNGNTFTYTPSGILVPTGRPLNSEFINQFPQATLEREITDVVINGDPDYILHRADLFVNTQGSSNSFDVKELRLFDEGRFVILPPNTEMLIEAPVEGTATGTVDITTTFFLTEFSLT